MNIIISLFSGVLAATITGSNGVTYSVRPIDTDTLLFNITGPSEGYAAVGIGSAMANSLMFVARPSNGAVSVELRTASGHEVPVSITGPIVQVMNSALSDTFRIDFVCSSCSTWRGGSIEQYTNNGLTSFIRAEGSVSNDIGFHGENYGSFQVDLQTGAVKTSSRTHLWKAHAILSVLGFFGLLYIGIMIGLFYPGDTRFRLHYCIQILGTLIGTAGVALGIYESSDGYDTHQALGLTLFAAILLQAIVGSAKRLWAARNGLSFPFMPLKVTHTILGSFILIGVVVNTGLGMSYEIAGIDRSIQITWYVVGASLVTIYWVSRIWQLLQPAPNQSIALAQMK